MKRIFFMLLMLLVVSSCSPLDWNEDKNLAQIYEGIHKTFGVTIPNAPQVTINIARQRIAPKDFAIIRVKFDDLPLLDLFERHVEIIAGVKEKVEANEFILKTESVSWWNFEDVAQSTRYRIYSKVSGMAKRIDIIFPAPKTGYVYMEISGQNWEK